MDDCGFCNNNWVARGLCPYCVSDEKIDKWLEANGHPLDTRLTIHWSGRIEIHSEGKCENVS